MRSQEKYAYTGGVKSITGSFLSVDKEKEDGGHFYSIQMKCNLTVKTEPP